jgi:predicted nicotinamide N-methyase
LTQAERIAQVREYTRVAPAPLVPEIVVHQAERLVPLWQATEWRAAAPQPPPFWAFVWPGSAALARYMLDTPSVVRDKGVLDFGSGSGLAAIAARLAGAAEVVAYDLDPLAAVAQQLNAALNGVLVSSVTGDASSSACEAEVILAGDVCYEREPAEATLIWLRQRAAEDRLVLLADPGRHYAPTDGLDLLQTYEVPVLRELESTEVKRTRLWRVRP